MTDLIELEAYRDTDESFDIAVKQPNGSPQNLTGAALTWTARYGHNVAGAAVIQKTTASGITIDSAPSGQAHIDLLPADISSTLFPRARVLVWDLVMELSGKTSVVAEGTLFIRPDVK